LAQGVHELSFLSGLVSANFFNFPQIFFTSLNFVKKNPRTEILLIRAQLQ
jgi:hypothetical protein